MEYVGERVSPALGNPGDPRGRPYVEPDVEVYIMEVPGKQAAAVAIPAAALAVAIAAVVAAQMFLEALLTRNHSAFAAFACSRYYANMEKRSVHWQHWDSRVPHVAYFATRDINPGDELCYMRGDGLELSSSDSTCKCGREHCSGKF